MVGIITRKTKREGQKKSKEAALARTKEGRELVLLIVRSYVIENPSNFTCI
jgi:hypothetical protein